MEDTLVEGEKYFADRRFFAAKRKFTACVRAQKFTYKAKSLRFLCSFQQDEFTECLDDLNSLIEHEPTVASKNERKKLDFLVCRLVVLERKGKPCSWTQRNRS